MQNIEQVLHDLAIPFERFEHEAFFTYEDAKAFAGQHPGGHYKNLLIRNKDGSKHYLVILDGDKRLDIKALTAVLNETKLSFASEETLLELMGLKPGSVSPFGLINDQRKQISLIVDPDLWKHEYVYFHPNINSATIKLRSEDLRKFFDKMGYTYQAL